MSEDLEKGWEPDHSPTQKAAFNDPSRFLLIVGPKGTGKTIVGLDKAVRHCFENPHALVLIITPTASAGQIGVLSDLERIVLPRWKEGNRVYSKGQIGDLVDNGVGLQYTDSKMDPKTKDITLRVRSFFEQSNDPRRWGTILFKSIPHFSQVKDRIYGIVPSMVLLDEVTNMGGEEYLIHPAAQLNRRAGINGVQQLVGMCNPAGPSSWVYKHWYVNPFDPETKEQVDHNYQTYFLDIFENEDRLPSGYLDGLKSLFRTNNTEYRRLVQGEWVDVPDGESIFHDYFEDAVHMMGDQYEGTGVLPVPGNMVYVGMDPGVSNFSAHFTQRLDLGAYCKWLVFDEANYVGKRTPYQKVGADIADRMAYWNEKLGTEFRYRFIADADSFTRRNSAGSLESREIEQHINDRIRQMGYMIPFARLEKCPKGKGSVATRIRLLQDLLMSRQILISAACPKTKDMLMFLRYKKPKDGSYDPEEGFKPIRSPQLHPFDSLTYPILKVDNTISMPTTGSVRPSVYTCGSGG